METKNRDDIIQAIVDSRIESITSDYKGLESYLKGAWLYGVTGLYDLSDRQLETEYENETGEEVRIQDQEAL